MMKFFEGSVLLSIASIWGIARAELFSDTAYNHTFQLIGNQVCEIFTVVEHPSEVEIFVPKNKVFFWDECGTTLTVTNAPTRIVSTITSTETILPGAPQTCTNRRCQTFTEVITTTIRPCDETRCTAIETCITITKTRAITTERVGPTGFITVPSSRPGASTLDIGPTLLQPSTDIDFASSTSSFIDPSVLPIPRSCGSGLPLCPLAAGSDSIRQCCRSTDLTCGEGAGFCGRECLPQFGDCFDSSITSTSSTVSEDFTRTNDETPTLGVFSPSETGTADIDPIAPTLTTSILSSESTQDFSIRPIPASQSSGFGPSLSVTLTLSLAESGSDIPIQPTGSNTLTGVDTTSVLATSTASLITTPDASDIPVQPTGSNTIQGIDTTSAIAASTEPLVATSNSIEIPSACCGLPTDTQSTLPTQITTRPLDPGGVTAILSSTTSQVVEPSSVGPSPIVDVVTTTSAPPAVGTTRPVCGFNIGLCDFDNFECCNAEGQCGTTVDFCSVEAGCNPLFGAECKECGPGFGSCPNPGDCCSAAGKCGSRADGFCADGCQEGFGAACTNCAFVPPPPPPTVLVDIGQPLAARLCCQWFIIDDIATCNNLGLLGIVELDELERLNPGAVGPGCTNLQAGAAYCLRGIPPFFQIQARDTITAANQLLLEGQDDPGFITGFNRGPPWAVDTYRFSDIDGSLVSESQVLYAFTDVDDLPPTVRLYPRNPTPPAEASRLTCLIVDGSGRIACGASAGLINVFIICNAPGEVNRLNLCLGRVGDVGGNYVDTVNLYAV